jgi:hypothetical protein
MLITRAWVARSATTMSSTHNVHARCVLLVLKKQQQQQQLALALVLVLHHQHYQQQHDRHCRCCRGNVACWA